MLAHLKAKQREHKTTIDEPVTAPSSVQEAQPSVTSQSASVSSDPENCPTTTMTCQALCALSYVPPSQMNDDNDNDNDNEVHEFDFSPPGKEKGGKKGGGCPKQHQLPMFLSKTYHMIDRCDSTIASWSPAGDNFVVKNVEKFAGTVLPKYFKHSNFSSFARQLNFYGFRKLKAEPILTADFDARTACYVRFYHEKFQKDRPELLAQIKRATKSDQQSKDDVESLKIDIMKLKECMGAMGAEHDRRMSEMSYEYNRRITALSAEYDKLAMLVQQLLSSQGGGSPNEAQAAAKNGVPDMMRSLSQVAAMSLQNSLRPPSLTAAAAAASGPSTYVVVPHQKRPSNGDTLGAPPASRPRFS